MTEGMNRLWQGWAVKKHGQGRTNSLSRTINWMPYFMLTEMLCMKTFAGKKTKSSFSISLQPDFCPYNRTTREGEKCTFLFVYSYFCNLLKQFTFPVQFVLTCTWNPIVSYVFRRASTSFSVPFTSHSTLFTITAWPSIDRCMG